MYRGLQANNPGHFENLKQELTQTSQSVPTEEDLQREFLARLRGGTCHFFKSTIYKILKPYLGIDFNILVLDFNILQRDIEIMHKDHKDNLKIEHRNLEVE